VDVVDIWCSVAGLTCLQIGLTDATGRIRLDFAKAAQPA